MKKTKKREPKPKEFSAKPFALLKGVQAAAAPAPGPEAAKPAAPKTGERRDADLFLQAMADVKRLHDSRRPAGPARAPQEPPPRPLARRIEEEERQLFLAELDRIHLDKTFHDELPDEVAPVRPQAVNRMRQLRRGTIRLDYELDLHGLTRDEALEALAAFVSGAFHRGQQAVLVITGRGNNSPGEPVLQGAVAGWLRATGKGMVAEFAVAPRQLGGEGAVVVFLREKEKSPGNTPP